MAKPPRNLNSFVSGKMGNLVVYERDGKTVLRSRPIKTKKKPSAKQIYTRKAFKKANAFLTPIRSELEFGFSGLSDDKSKRFGKALSLAIKQAILPVDGEPNLHPERVKISSGDVLEPADAAAKWEASNRLVLTWRPNSFEGMAKDGDEIFYVALDPDTKRKWSVEKGGYRKNGSLTIDFPWTASLAGQFYHYLAFYTQSSSKVEFSNSICLGRI